MNAKLIFVFPRAPGKQRRFVIGPNDLCFRPQVFLNQLLKNFDLRSLGRFIKARAFFDRHHRPLVCGGKKIELCTETRFHERNILKLGSFGQHLNL